ncbi:unnamed protein product (macronuclear) [Paramecium tetraurelia]|uniref:Uncharacterized protein n=1 Tax=Paramecium tetraurelia TaxID=5888 RepID=A0E1U9_PARTE|nr:uncharacterized protein GSPATT00022437001 [Paramecium tetraurelia]CAK89266.1 unnamed protein product [Paramecium tetraurelia]|eukprot:XP_001456663.1 hypothetical protein (macronuclear) [Paramecium tetraurelia strain d4-2]
MLLCFRLWSFDKQTPPIFQIYLKNPTLIINFNLVLEFGSYQFQRIIWRSSFFKVNIKNYMSMQVAQLPKGGVNKGQVIPLKCSCPPDCKCKSPELREWHHKPCSEMSYISQYGDIFCRHHLSKCDGYFIKDASFQCAAAQQANTWNQYRHAAQFLMAIAQGLQAAEFTLSANDQIHFAATLNTEVIRRWNQ